MKQKQPKNNSQICTKNLGLYIITIYRINSENLHTRHTLNRNKIADKIIIGAPINIITTQTASSSLATKRSSNLKPQSVHTLFPLVIDPHSGQYLG